MPTVQANGIDIYYEVQGEGEPLVLIPYLAADQACYAFQVAEYTKHFACYTVDLRGAGLTSTPDGSYSTELLAGDVAAFMQAAGVDRAHVAGPSLGAATGMWLVAAFLRQSEAVLAHDGSAALGEISAPTLITFGRHDQVTSMRFADALTTGMAGSELNVFEDCSHAPIYQNVEAFNERTLAFLRSHSAGR